MNNHFFHDLWKEQSVLVIGGSGFLGQAILQQLIAKGCKRIVAFNRSPIPQELIQQGIEYFPGDITDEKAVDQAVQDASIIFQTASKTHYWGTPQSFYQINVTGTEHILNAIQKKKNSTPFIYTGSPSSTYVGNTNICNLSEEKGKYPTHFLAEYSLSKAIAEKKVLATASDHHRVVSLRPHLIYGPKDPHIIPKIIQMAKLGRLRQIGKGNNLVDLTYIENAAYAHLLAAEKLLNPNPQCKINGHAFYISDHHPVNLWTWIFDLLIALKLPPPKKAFPYPIAYCIGALFESLYPYSKDPPMTRYLVAQLAHSHYFNPTLSKNLLEYSPLISPEEGFQKTVDFFIKK